MLEIKKEGKEERGKKEEEFATLVGNSSMEGLIG